MQIQINAKQRTWTLTDERAESTYGVPVLVDDRGNAYAAREAVMSVEGEPDSIAAGFVTCAAAIADYAKDDHPHDQQVHDLVDRYVRAARNLTV